MESQDLRKVGLKVTHPRMRILELLEQKNSQHHLSAEDIYRQLLEHGDQLLFAAGLIGQLQAGRRAPHQHVDLGAAMIVVIPLTVDTEVGIASRVPFQFHMHILLLHPINNTPDRKITGPSPI